MSHILKIEVPDDPMRSALPRVICRERIKDLRREALWRRLPPPIFPFTLLPSTLFFPRPFLPSTLFFPLTRSLEDLRLPTFKLHFITGGLTSVVTARK